MKSFVTLDKFPFEVRLNLLPLISLWEDLAASEDELQASCAKTVVESIKKVPELSAKNLNRKTFEKHRKLIGFLFTGIFSPYQAENGISGANVPYHMDMIYTTRKFQQLFGKNHQEVQVSIFNDEAGNYYGPTLHAYSIILKKFYNIDISFDIPVFKIRRKNKTNDLTEYYQMKTDIRFSTIRAKGKIRKLTEKEKTLINENYFDLSVWMEIIPPEHFYIEGFGMFTVQEDSLQLSATAIQNKLLEKESIIKPDKFAGIERRMQSMLGLPKIRMGIAVFNKDPRSFLLFRNTWITVLSDNMLVCTRYQDSIYEKAAVKGDPIVVPDLTELEEKTVIEEQLIAEGLRSMIVLPLYFEKELVGLVELASPNPGDFSTGTLVKLHPVMSAFGIAAKRQAIDLENRIKAKIQEDFTAIHPAVEWKFEQIAIEQLNLELTGGKAKKQHIVFRDIYPLFGVSDVKSSSNKRNEAIRADLLDQLKALTGVIKTVKSVRPLPILDHLNYNLGRMHEDIDNEISTGDEVKILDYIRTEVEPVLKHLRSLQEELEGTIDVYFDMLDDELGIFYKQRKDFEDSMRMINDGVSEIIDRQEDEAQKMYPHYFEKYRTDGIEYSIYIGESLVQNQPFDYIYLKNIRLWQLLVMCEVARETEKMAGHLPMKLETTHLILAHNQPITIRFRDDEKKFDVEGAYNLRYEITKKRIDKATVKGTSERIVQPRHIAIIYSQESERIEYLKYLEYLVATGHIDDNIEQFDIESMQGIYGLRALRVNVVTGKKEASQYVLSDVEDAIRQIESAN